MEKDTGRDRMERVKRERVEAEEGRKNECRGGPEAGIKGKQQERWGGDRLCNISINNRKQF